jgi:predicted ester cyclase
MFVHGRRLTPAALLAVLALATAGHAQAPGRPAGPAKGPTQGDLILQASIVASHTDPTKWDWPSSATPEVRQQITAGRYSPEELRNIFTTLARQSGPSWPDSGPKAASPNLDILTAPDAITHGRGFKGLETFYGGNGYGGISDRVNRIDTLIAHGDRVFISWVWEGRHTGTLFGFPGDGKVIHVRESSMTRFKDGKAVELDISGDDLALYTQAGGKIGFPDKAQ